MYSEVNIVNFSHIFYRKVPNNSCSRRRIVYIFMPVAPKDSEHITANCQFLSDYLLEKRKDANFETLPDTLLAEILRTFFAEVRKQDSKPYSKSAMVNLRAGLNRYLQSPPHNRIINLMHHDAFQNANSVFSGVLRDNKEQGYDKSKPKTSIAPADLDKLYDEYFIPGLAANNVTILQQKVFFDLVYYTARRGKEGLRQLRKDWFVIKNTAEGQEYVEIIVNETTKKNQGDNCSTRINNVHNDENIMFAQPGSERCPLASFKQYISLLSDKIPWLFQKPNVRKNKFDAQPVGKHPLNNMMATISESAGLSKRYTNHNIRRTSGNAMQKGGAAAPRIAHHLRQKNIQSMMHYLDMPTIEEKQENAQLLFNYTHKEGPPPQPAIAAAPVQPNLLQHESHHTDPAKEAPIVQVNKENVAPENALIPFEAVLNENLGDQQNLPVVIPSTVSAPVPLQQAIPPSNNHVVTNQLRQAPVMFQGATFQNCTINLNVPQ